MEQRIPVLDSCILLSNPDLVGYEGKLVYIPLAVYRELDRQKTYEGLVGFKARAVNRRLKFPVGSESFVYYHEEESNIRVLVPNDELEARLNPSLEEPKADDSFINMAILEEGTNFVLHTADKSLAYLAKLQHKQVEFIADANRAFLENIYSGHREIWVTDAEYSDLSLIDTSNFYPNEYLLIRTHTGFRLGKVKGSRVVPVVKDKKLYGVAPKNLEQRFLFDAILDDDVKVIILSGSAGTGKTLVSLAGGLNGIESGQYSQLILAKSLASLNKQEETGFLPK